MMKSISNNSRRIALVILLLIWVVIIATCHANKNDGRNQSIGSVHNTITLLTTAGSLKVTGCALTPELSQ